MDVVQPVSAAMPPAIDRDRLAAQTFDDPALARELLAMFAAQMPTLLAALAGAEGAARSDIAHRIKGSALAIGAVEASEAAARLEVAPGNPQLVLELQAACAAVLAEVAME